MLLRNVGASVLVVASLACSKEPATEAPTATAQQPTPSTSVPAPAQTDAPASASTEPLPALPGEVAPLVDATLLDKWKRLDSGFDGWSTEVFNERAGPQLAKLGELLAHPQDLDEQHLAALLDASFASSALRPASLAVARDEHGVRVLRATAEQPETTHASLAGAAEALRALAAPFTGATDIVASFEMISVEPDDTHVETVAYMQVKGRPPTGATQQNATWRVRWTPLPSEPVDAAPKILGIAVSDFAEVVAAGAGAPLFENCTQAVLGANASWTAQLAPGLEHWAATLDIQLGISLIGHEGIALGDVDGDQLDDLYVCQPGGLPNLLFVRQADGTLLDVSRDAGVDFLDASRSALLADYDNDGDRDLAVALDPRILFLQNDGRGRFTLAFDAEAPSTSSLSAADFDGDGDLDLYCCGYVLPDTESTTPLPYHDANNGRPNTLLRNEGDARAWKFVDATREVGLDRNNRRFSFASAWEDYDDDGDQDLYVANDFGRNNLYRNDGGKFRDVAAEAGVEGLSSGMGVTWGDYDLDGKVDLCTSNLFSSAGERITHQQRFMPEADGETRAGFQRHARGNTLFRNLGGGAFADVSGEAGVTIGRWAWGALFTELDNDGRPDLFCPNGYVTGEDPQDLASFFWRQVVSLSPTAHNSAERSLYDAGWIATHKLLRDGKSWGRREEDCSFLNTGDGHFANVSAVTGLDLPDDTRAAARVDWDLDGRLDLWISGRNSPRLHFFRNRAPQAGGYVALYLRGTGCNRDAIGARVEIHREGAPTLIQTQRAGEGFLSQSSAWMHFGLGASADKVRAVVRWPAPHSDKAPAVEEFELAANSRAVLVQGSGRAEPWSRPGAAIVLAPSEPAPLAASEKARIVLAARVPVPPLAMLTHEGQTGDILASLGKPMLVNLWATWCAPCVAELRVFSESEEKLRAAGLNLVAVNCDDAKDRAKALELLERLQWKSYAGYATPELLDTLDVLQRALLDRHRRLPLPASFLIDHDGRLAAIYKGPVAIDTLLADVSRLRASPTEIRDAAVPFRGRWHAAPPQADFARVENAFRERGLNDAAAAIARGRTATRETSEAHVLNEFGMTKARAGRMEEALADFAHAVELDPKFFDARNNLATALHEAGRLEEAIAMYESALRLNSRNASTVYNLALAHWANGDRDTARQDLALLEILDREMGKELAQQLAQLEQQR